MTFTRLLLTLAPFALAVWVLAGIGLAYLLGWLR